MILSSATALVLLLGSSAGAAPVDTSDDAQVACGAADMGDGTAYVPAENQGKQFRTIPTSPALPVLCGNGSTTGAVHIEVKHPLPNWEDASICIKRVLQADTAPEDDPNSDKETYAYTFGGIDTIVVRGASSLITAYNRQGTVEGWTTCAYWQP